MHKTIAGLDCRIRKGNSSEQAVVMLHGYGADQNDLFSLADILDPDGDWDFYFPNGPFEVPIGPMWTGRAWFPISLRDLEDGIDWTQIRPPGLDEASEKIFGLVFDLNVKKLVLGGFSQGSMVATDVALHNPDAVSGLIAFSAVLLDEPNWSKLADKFNGPIYQSHGRQDPVLPYEYAERLARVLKKGPACHRFTEFNGAHEIPPQALMGARDLIQRLSV